VLQSETDLLVHLINHQSEQPNARKLLAQIRRC
jgi:hypothetical protein